jgi:hypothetical protein
MLIRKRTAAQALSISALDLFASALGVFVLMFVILLPFYLRQPSIEAAKDGASAQLAKASARATTASNQARAAQEEIRNAREALDVAESRAARLQSTLDARTADLRAMPEEIPAPAPSEQSGRRESVADGTISIEDLDLVIVMDTTGSMRDELADLRANLASIARILNRLSPDLRIGFVSFRDRDAPPILNTFPLRSMGDHDLVEILRFVDALEARGGGDKPEPVDQALEAAVGMEWRKDAKGRIIVIGDAPAPPAYWAKSNDLAARFLASGTGKWKGYDRAVSVILTGRGASTERFFRELATAGGGEVSAHRGAMIESVLLTILR